MAESITNTVIREISLDGSRIGKMVGMVTSLNLLVSVYPLGRNGKRSGALMLVNKGPLRNEVQSKSDGSNAKKVPTTVAFILANFDVEALLDAVLTTSPPLFMVSMIRRSKMYSFLVDEK